MKIKKTAQKGFTLIEILVVVALIAILAAVVVFALNPAKRFQQARDTTRTNDVNALASAIAVYLTDGGSLSSLGTIPDCTDVAGPAVIGTSGVDLAASPLIPNHISTIPMDPGGSSTKGTTANTGYTICQNSTNGRVTIAAADPEIATEIKAEK